jgi:predicted metalloprotease with PDZ domain
LSSGCYSQKICHTARLFPGLLLLALSAIAPHAPAQESALQTERIGYHLEPLLNETPRRLKVEMEIPTDGQERVSVQMPVWSPGDYHLQNHARYVQDFQASALFPDQDIRPLPFAHPDANTWLIQTDGAKFVKVRYYLPETPPGFFSENVQLREKQVFVNGPAAYMYVVGRKDAPADLLAYMPENWSAEMPLPQGTPGVVQGNTAAFLAPDYDTLADSPLLMAAPDAMTIREFSLNGVTHRAVYFGKKESVRDFDAYTPALRQIAAAENRIMGVTPYARYDFFFEVGGRGGGLEHLNAARLTFFPAPPRALAPFIAHEFFHLWNVKRIRPRVLGPFDYIHPPRTRCLWFAEGVTEYYAHVATRRAGLYSEDDFYRHWRGAIQALQRDPARLKVTADESSLRVWEAGNSSGYGGLSYYAKGELIGLCLDLKTRHLTDNKRSLDEVMRLLMQRHNPPRPGYGEDELRATVSEVAGQDLSAFYDLLARSTQEMPFRECLSYAGLDIELKPLPEATPAQVALRQSWAAGWPENGDR